MLARYLITSHGNSRAARQGLQVSPLVALSYLPVAPLPAGGDYTRPHNTICLSPGENSNTVCAATLLAFVWFVASFSVLAAAHQPLLSSGDYEHNVIQCSCFAGYSHALCAYSGTSSIQTTGLCSDVGGRAGHFHITRDDTFISNVALGSKRIPRTFMYAVLFYILFYDTTIHSFPSQWQHRHEWICVSLMWSKPAESPLSLLKCCEGLISHQLQISESTWKHTDSFWQRWCCVMWLRHSILPWMSYITLFFI